MGGKRNIPIYSVLSWSPSIVDYQAAIGRQDPCASSISTMTVIISTEFNLSVCDWDTDGRWEWTDAIQQSQTADKSTQWYQLIEGQQGRLAVIICALDHPQDYVDCFSTGNSYPVMHVNCVCKRLCVREITKWVNERTSSSSWWVTSALQTDPSTLCTLTHTHGHTCLCTTPRVKENMTFDSGA